MLRRLAPTLSAVGVDVQHKNREPGTGKRLLVLTTITPPPDPAATMSPQQSSGRTQGVI